MYDTSLLQGRTIYKKAVLHFSIVIVPSYDWFQFFIPIIEGCQYYLEMSLSNLMSLQSHLFYIKFHKSVFV